MAQTRLSEATKKRLKAGRMLLAGKGCAEVALAVGVARQTVYTWKGLLGEGEWHLLCRPIMAVALDLGACVGSGSFQPRIGFGPSFSHSRLDAPRPMAHFGLRDQCE